MSGRPTWAEIDLDALTRNYRTLASLLRGRSRLIPVVKADAYGHGAASVSMALARAGTTAFAVALVEEGIALRDAGISGEILVLEGAFPGQEDEVVSRAFTATVFSPDMVRRLEKAASSRSVQVSAHIKIDTGMNRLGASWHSLASLLEALRDAAHIRVTGTFSHLACAEEEDREFTLEQIRRFRQGLGRIREAGIDPGEIHLANSAGLLYWEELRGWTARPGIALYGYPPSPERCPAELRPVLTFKSRVARIQTISAGESVGYNRRFIARRKTDVATVPVGYADGYRRSLGGKAKVIVKGRCAEVLGTISMDMITVDVTEVPDARVGDEVILLGSSANCRVDAASWADALGTIPYEILCGISPRVPRIPIHLPSADCG
ncbi:MAG: alanine racemase [Acidobacteria bacterium]|nr:alanine racemase [Acidobacteriota bacterium]